jgi:hypothetical protein
VDGLKDPADPLVQVTHERQTDPEQGLTGEEVQPHQGQACNNQENQNPIIHSLPFCSGWFMKRVSAVFK